MDEIEPDKIIETHRLKFFKNKTGLVFIKTSRNEIGLGKILFYKISGGKRKEKTSKKDGKYIKIIDIDELYLKSPDIKQNECYEIKSNYINEIYRNFDRYRKNYLDLMSVNFTDD